jgi:hypothetical protein
MKIRNTDVNGGLSGKMLSGGRVASYRNGRTYSSARTFVKPNNPNTSLQQLIRSSFTGGVVAWKSLSENEQSAWNEAKGTYRNLNSFGGNFKTGRNCFIGARVLCSQASIALPTYPTANVLIGAESFSVDASGGSISLNITNGEAVVNNNYIVKCSSYLNDGASVLPTVFVNGIYYSDAIGDVEINLTTSIIAKTGTYVAGKRFIFELLAVGQGGNAYVAYKTTVTLT